MTDDIGPLHAFAYANGVDAIQNAVDSIIVLMDVHRTIASHRAADPKSHPQFPIELTDESLAQRIVGELLDAGWKPPVIEAS